MQPDQLGNHQVHLRSADHKLGPNWNDLDYFGHLLLYEPKFAAIQSDLQPPSQRSIQPVNWLELESLERGPYDGMRGSQGPRMWGLNILMIGNEEAKNTPQYLIS